MLGMSHSLTVLGVVSDALQNMMKVCVYQSVLELCFISAISDFSVHHVNICHGFLVLLVFCLGITVSGHST